LLLGELYPRENEVIPKVRKRRGGRPGFEVFVWRRLTLCQILSAMSSKIQEWSHKSRSRINNLYVLTQLIREATLYPITAGFRQISVTTHVQIVKTTPHAASG